MTAAAVRGKVEPEGMMATQPEELSVGSLRGFNVTGTGRKFARKVSYTHGHLDATELCGKAKFREAAIRGFGPYHDCRRGSK